MPTILQEKGRDEEKEQNLLAMEPAEKKRVLTRADNLETETSFEAPKLSVRLWQKVESNFWKFVNIATLKLILQIEF